MGHLRSKVRNQPDQHGETPSLLKKSTKLARYGGTFWEAEAGESLESACNPSYLGAEAGELLEPGRWRLQ